MGSFKKTLEKKGKELAASSSKKSWDNSVSSIVRREIALTVDQIQRLKKLYENQFKKLLQQECAIDTDLIQLEQRIPRYSRYIFPEKEKLKHRIFLIEMERRDLSLRLEEKTQGLG